MRNFSRAGIIPLLLILVVVGLLAIGGGAYYMTTQRPASSLVPASLPTSPVIPTSTEPTPSTSTSPPTEPSPYGDVTFQATSPNGGEVWSFGEERKITWESNVIGQYGEYVYIWLISPKCEKENCLPQSLEGGYRESSLRNDAIVIARLVPNTGSFIWKVPMGLFPASDPYGSNWNPSNVPEGKYKILIHRAYENVRGITSDKSDNYFSIVK